MSDPSQFRMQEYTIAQKTSGWKLHGCWSHNSVFYVMYVHIKEPEQRGHTAHTCTYDSLPFTFLHVVTKRKLRRAGARVLWNKEKRV